MDAGGVYGESESLDPPISYDVRTQDLRNIVFGFELVPGPLWIDHHHRSVLAHVHAAGVIDPNPLHAQRHSEAAHEVA